MPFRLLGENKQKKLMTSSLTLPVASFLLGLTITLFLANTFYKSDLALEKERLSHLVVNYYENQNLQLNNSILRLQHYDEFALMAKSRDTLHRSIVRQIVATTIFEKVISLRITGVDKKDKLPLLRQTNSFKNSSSESGNAEYDVSLDIRRKIHGLLQDNSTSTMALNVDNGVYFISLIMRSANNPHEVIIFESNLAQFFKDWPQNELLAGYIGDEKSGVHIRINFNPERKGIQLTQIDRVPAANETSLVMEKSFFVDERYDVFFTATNNTALKPSMLVITVLSFGLLLTALFSLFLRFVLEQNSRIYRLVVSRTEQLEQAMNEAQQANKAKTQFLANMSHELRTPLNLILGMNEILQKNVSDPKLTEYLKSMQTASEHLLNLITDLITISKDQAEALEIKNNRFYTLSFFEEIALIIGPECFKKNLNFYLNIDTKIPMQLIGDEVKIRQIILNLLRNALKYTTHGHIALNVKLVKYLTSKGLHLQIEVLDTGIGIPKNKMNYIFERFFQIDEAKMLAEGGVGLGLSIVKELVSKLNGNISVKSEEGLGSTFKVDLDLEYFEEGSWAEHYFIPDQEQNVLLVCKNSSEILMQLDGLLQQFNFKCSYLGEKLLKQDLSLFQNYDALIFAPDCTPEFVSQLSLIDSAQRKFIYCINDMANNERQELPYNTLNIYPILPSHILGLLGLRALTKAPEKISDPLESQLLHLGKKDRVSVLVVDDDTGNRELIKAYLDDPSYELHFAQNGVEGLEKYPHIIPDIVLADLRMPLMNGLELTDAIRKLEQNSSPQKPARIILLTADVLEETAQRAKLYDIDLYLTKPIRRAKLLESINSLLDK